MKICSNCSRRLEEALVIEGVVLELREFEETAYAYHEEFIEIARVDRAEFQAFKQRHGRVRKPLPVRVR